MSRQTISKWETDETLPDIRQAKRLALLYGLSLDELISFDMDIKALEQVIEKTSDGKTQNLDPYTFTVPSENTNPTETNQ